MKKPLLLIADDQPDNLKIIKDILNQEEEKYTFITVPNGRVLVEIAIKKLPDLIITDWEMPEMNGLEAIRLLKKEETTKDIPVIMYTGIMTSTENLKVALDAGAVDFVRKPIEPTELIARVQSMLQLADSFRKIKEQNEELEKLNSVKDRLLSIISHDVRSPLSSFKGVLFLLKNDALTKEELKTVVNSAGNQIEQISTFLDNLLRWTKNQLLGLEAKPKALILKDLISECVDLLSFIAKSKKINVNANIAENLSIYADEEMMKIVIRNLISNALKFCSEDDEINIRAEKHGEEITVYVEDTGTGINEENLALLFGVSHLSTKGTKEEMGTGIGLSLCKEMIERNGGKIYVTSIEGKGSCFWFDIPAK
jgi:two-component system, sensor histidine kinase and response regulator